MPAGAYLETGNCRAEVSGTDEQTMNKPSQVVRPVLIPSDYISTLCEIFCRQLCLGTTAASNTADIIINILHKAMISHCMQ